MTRLTASGDAVHRARRSPSQLSADEQMLDVIDLEVVVRRHFGAFAGAGCRRDGRFGPLPEEAVAVTAAGPDEGTPVLDRAWVKDAEAAPDGHTVIALIVEHGSEIYRRLAPLSAAIETAASIDPDVAAHQRVIRDSRRRGMAHLIDVLAAKGALRHDLDRQDAADVLFALQSPQTYLAFVTHCGWPLDKWKTWQRRLLCDQLLDR